MFEDFIFTNLSQTWNFMALHRILRLVYQLGLHHPDIRSQKAASKLAKAYLLGTEFLGTSLNSSRRGSQVRQELSSTFFPGS